MSYHGGTSILLQIRCCKLSCTHLLCLQTYMVCIVTQKSAVVSTTELSWPTDTGNCVLVGLGVFVTFLQMENGQGLN